MNSNPIQSSSRLLSLDVMRGITIAGMILVNNPGSWEAVYAPLRHAAWNGLTPTDLVFPFFLFILGISSYASLRKFDFRPTPPTIHKILKRTFLIFLIGILLNWFGLFFSNLGALEQENLPFATYLWRAATQIGHLRIMGVLPRLALCYGAASLIGVMVKHKHIPYVIVAGLIGYFVVLLGVNGFAYDASNTLCDVDRWLFSTDHIYIDRCVDPEGLLSTIPSICQALIGFCCGKMIFDTRDNKERMLKLLLTGAILTFMGLLLHYGCPMNKKIWSPTFVLATCGLGASLLAVLIWIIDVRGYKSGFRFFEAFGVNPLAIYVFSGILATLIGFVQVGGQSVKGALYALLNGWFGPYPASLLSALLLIAVCWAVAYPLYKRKIYIKL
ncbi:MAG: heparan-alpha-glucosaminide N-acetyltransferase domain-containing protein [Alistipes sp.]